MLCGKFRKAEAAYRHPHTWKLWPRMMLESYILPNIFQLTYVDELYGECNGTARACANSGYLKYWEKSNGNINPLIAKHTSR